MDLLIIQTQTTPKISYYADTNEWIISGRSYPTEAFAFYAPVLQWFDGIEDMNISKCSFQFRLEFFNTCSSRILLEILLRLKVIMDRGKIELCINWFYEADDVDMKESGEMLMGMANLPLKLLMY